MYQDNLPRVAGVEVEIRKVKRYKGRMGSRGGDRAKEKEKKMFLKIYEDQLGSKLEQQLFPSNGARELVGYFNDANKSARARIPS